MRRRIHENTSRQQAIALRETFMDRPHTSETEVSWGWPKKLREVGEIVAVMYTSDKWKAPGDYEDYKHIAEGPQLCFVADGFMRDHAGESVATCGPMVSLGSGMPDHIAVLAPILGVQVRLYQKRGRSHYLPNEGSLYQVDIPKAKLAAGINRETGETFLCVFSKDECVMLITGKILGVEKDGIVG